MKTDFQRYMDFMLAQRVKLDKEIIKTYYHEELINRVVEKKLPSEILKSTWEEIFNRSNN